MAKFGTRHADFAVGVCFAYLSHPFGGVILCIFLLSDAVSLYYRDIFSGTKLTKSLFCCWTLLVIMLGFHIL